MKVITWNIRGLNSPRKQKILKNKLKMEKPDICFIQETKCTTDKMVQISRKSWNTYNFLDIDSQNSVGGILTLWNPQKVDLISAEATRHYLSVILQVIGTPDKVMCTNVYGPQLLEDKKKMITGLENLRDRNMNPHWILAGDFNIIVTLAEKKGGV
jgi:exonuclease III